MSDERFDLIVALYALCSDHHSGQWSRGYRILSRIQTAYKPRNIPCTKDDLTKDDWFNALMIYEELESKYADSL